MKLYRIVSLMLALMVFAQNFVLASDPVEIESATVEAPKKDVYHIALTAKEADESGISRDVREALKEIEARQDKVRRRSAVAYAIIGVSMIGGIVYVLPYVNPRPHPGIALAIFLSNFIGSSIAIEQFTSKSPDHDKAKKVVPLIQSHLDTTCGVVNDSTGRSVRGNMMIQSMMFPPEAFADGQVRLDGRAISQTEYENLVGESTSPSYVFVSTEAKCETGIFSSATLAELSH